MLMSLLETAMPRTAVVFHCWLNSQLKLIEKERANPETGRCCGIIHTALAAERRLW